MNLAVLPARRLVATPAAIALTLVCLGLLGCSVSCGDQRALISSTVLAVAALLIPAGVQIVRGRLAVLSHTSILLLCVALYTLTVPITLILFTHAVGAASQFTPFVARYFGVPPPGILTAVNMFVVAGAGAFWVGWWFGSTVAPNLRVPGATQIMRLTDAGVHSMVGTGTVLTMALFAAVGGPGRYLSAGYCAPALEEGYGQFAIGLPILAMATPAYLAMGFERKRSLRFVVWLVLSLLLVGLLVATGRRRLLLSLLLSGTVVWFFRYGQGSLLRAALAIAVLFLSLSAVGLVRGCPEPPASQMDRATPVTPSSAAPSPGSQTPVQPTADGEPGPTLSDNIDWVATRIRRTLSLEVLSYPFFTGGEFQAPYTALLYNVEHADAQPPALGRTYVANTLEQLVPRLIIGSRGSTLSEQYAANVARDGTKAAGGYGYHFFAEAFLNFGSLGPALVMLLAGIGSGLLEAVRKRSNAALILALYASIAAWTFTFVRIDFAVSFKALLEFVIAPLLLAGLAGSIWRSAKSRLAVHRSISDT